MIPFASESGWTSSPSNSICLWWKLTNTFVITSNHKYFLSSENQTFCKLHRVNSNLSDRFEMRGAPIWSQLVRKSQERQLVQQSTRVCHTRCAPMLIAFQHFIKKFNLIYENSLDKTKQSKRLAYVNYWSQSSVRGMGSVPWNARWSSLQLFIDKELDLNKYFT